MDPEYQRIARERYLLQKQKAEKEQQKINNNEQELTEFYTYLSLWDETITLTDTTIINKLEYLLVCLQTMLPIARKHDVFFKIEECVNALVLYLNTQFEIQPLFGEDLKIVEELMRAIINESGLDIPVEAMHTSDDERIALELARNLEQDYEEHFDPIFEPNFNVNNVFNNVLNNVFNNVPNNVPNNALNNVPNNALNDVPNNVPVVYPNSRRGMTLIELRELARNNGIATSGSKSDVCQRLVVRGFVRYE